jgi:large subunit ribosomal protein L18
MKSKVNSNYTVKIRRKRQKKTNYKKRLLYLKSGFTRLVVRTSSKDIIVQLVNYSESGDKVLATVNSKSLKKLGWKQSGGNVPCAYLCGLLIAKKKTDKVTEEVILDFGMLHVLSKSRIFAVVKGAKEAGLNINVDEKEFPSDETVSGIQIENYAKSLDDKLLNARFSEVIKNGTNPKNMVSDVKTLKKKILGV